MCRNNIWTISILAMFLFSGCAPSTQALVEQAQLTRDWSLVDKRYDAIERREAQRLQSCPGDMKLLCVKRHRKQSCSCLSNSEFRDKLDSLWSR